MAVRFLPTQASGRQHSQRGDRECLAEVIELRSRQRPVEVGSGNAASQAGESRVTRLEQLRAQAEAIQAAHRRAPTQGEPAPVSEPVSEPVPVAIAENLRTAADDAVRLLARKARSSGELRSELLALGHDPAEASDAVLDCESRLYLDDLGLARVLTETLRGRKGASRTQIRLKLRERLLPEGAIETALGELDEDEEYELLCAAAGDRARKLGGLDRQTAERRLLGFLARRGWSGERAVRAAREALDRG